MRRAFLGKQMPTSVLCASRIPRKLRDVGQIVNHLGQPIGEDLKGWKIPAWPPREPAKGRFCRLEPLDPDRDAAQLYSELAADREGRTWTYLPYGPFKDFDEFQGWLKTYCIGNDPLFYTITEQASGKALGLVSYLRINPADGVIEVGHVIFSPRLQRTPVATDAMYLMMKRAFDLGYRRYEWKCDSLNAKSRAAAERLGFKFEGIFRQDRAYKHRSRDTAWFSVIDREWPARKQAFERWLAPENFDGSGRQKTALRELK
jgi:RimJ/RimL family protein N-acetyltransferase